MGSAWEIYTIQPFFTEAALHHSDGIEYNRNGLQQQRTWDNRAQLIADTAKSAERRM